MPRRLLLDGEDIAALMRRVRAEMGPNAVVVKAERVRTGGVAGFFAKEHFELTVEVPDPGSRIPRRPLARRPAAPSRAAGISALLDAADAAEARSAGGSPLPPTPPAGPGEPAQLGWIAAKPVDRVPGEPAAIERAPMGAGAADLGAADPGAAETGPRLSTDAVTFASLLASIDDMADAPAPAGVVLPAAAQAAVVLAVPMVAAVAPGVPAVAPGVAPGPVHLPIAARALTAARFARAGAVVTPVKLEPIGRVPSRPRAGGGDRRALHALGVPPALLGDGPIDETLPLSDLLARLDRPPSLLRAPGAIVVVVGEKLQALAVASQLAERARQDPHEVVLAGDMQGIAGHGRRLLSASAAARHRERIAADDQVSIVALGVGPTPQDWPDAAALLSELGPDQAWAAVDARRKPADLRAWMSAVGGTRAFDVVAAAAVHETQEPGTVLGLGVPVGWIDGLPATPVVWAAVLSERLDVGARWD